MFVYVAYVCMQTLACLCMPTFIRIRWRWLAYVCTCLLACLHLHAYLCPHSYVGLILWVDIRLSADVYMHVYACMMHTLACLGLHAGVGLLK